MPLESATYISDLVSTNPVGTDTESQGDDHLRLLKAVLKATFPNLGGAAFRVQAKSASPYNVIVTDNTSLLNCTATLTINLPAAASCGNGFLLAVYGNGFAQTVDPASAELINGAATLTVPSGSIALIWCDGTAFHALVVAVASGAGTFQPLDATLTALAGVTVAADQLIYATGADAFTTASLTSFARTLLDDATQGAMQTTLGLVPGTNVQAFDQTLAALAGANWAANSLPIGSGADTVAQVTFAANTFPGRSSIGNLVAKTITDFGFSLVDDIDAPAARTTLGLGSIATQSAASVSITGGSVTGITDLALADGGTGASTAADARTNLGLVAGGAGDIWAEKAGDTMTGDLVLADVSPGSDFSAGFRGLPVVTLDVAGDILLTYSGKLVRHTSATAHAWTIQPNATIAHRVGAAIVLRNIGTGAVTITRGTGVTLRSAGSATDENKVLTQYGEVTIVQEATNVWVLSGTL